MGNPKECLKPHIILHSISGLGVGLVLATIFFGANQMALIFGIATFVATVVYEMVVGKNKMDQAKL